VRFWWFAASRVRPQSFGALNLGSELRSLSPERAIPSVAKWIMTLPEPDDSRAQNAAGDDIERLLAAEPIGGEIHHLTSLPGGGPAVASLVTPSNSVDRRRAWPP